MELFSNKFKQAVRQALDSKNKVLGTIGMIEDMFVKEIKNREDTETIILTNANYSKVKEMILKEFEIWK